MILRGVVALMALLSKARTDEKASLCGAPLVAGVPSARTLPIPYAL
jgi:hypothetical protein